MRDTESVYFFLRQAEDTGKIQISASRKNRDSLFMEAEVDNLAMWEFISKRSDCACQQCTYRELKFPVPITGYSICVISYLN